jgi:DNA-binding NarL/FixJ family response regulator
MIKIGIVDDHPIVRNGLKEYFAEQVDLRVVGEAASGREAVDLVRTTDMDVLLMDLSMPGQSGIDAMAMIRAKAPDLGILILSVYPAEQYAINLIKRGASGYLNKDAIPRRFWRPSAPSRSAGATSRQRSPICSRNKWIALAKGRCTSNCPSASSRFS